MDIVSPNENIIYEGKETIVVLSLDPISKGHVVIKPKKKYKDIDELPEFLLAKILSIDTMLCEIIITYLFAKRIFHCAKWRNV